MKNYKYNVPFYDDLGINLGSIGSARSIGNSDNYYGLSIDGNDAGMIFDDYEVSEASGWFLTEEEKTEAKIEKLANGGGESYEESSIEKEIRTFNPSHSLGRGII